jgi:hypothetical protein
MNCIEFESVVVAIARGEVMDAGALRPGLAHAEGCGRCAHRLASEKALSELMAAAVAEDSAREAPPRVGEMLVGAFRERRMAAQRLRRTWLRRVLAGAVAAILVLSAAVALHKAMDAGAAKMNTARLAKHDADTLAETGDEVMTDFIPVVYDPAPIGLGSVVRVQLPRAALSAFGLPVNEDRNEDLVQADLLLDDDGLMRAVRFVE